VLLYGRSTGISGAYNAASKDRRRNRSLWKIRNMVPNRSGRLRRFFPAPIRTRAGMGPVAKAEWTTRSSPAASFLRRRLGRVAPEMWSGPPGRYCRLVGRPPPAPLWTQQRVCNSYGDARGAYQSVRPGSTGAIEQVRRARVMLLMRRRRRVDERITRQMACRCVTDHRTGPCPFCCAPPVIKRGAAMAQYVASGLPR